MLEKYVVRSRLSFGVLVSIGHATDLLEVQLLSNTARARFPTGTVRVELLRAVK